MPLPGRTPTGNATSDRNPRVAEFEEIPNVPFTGGPPLPARRTNNRGWPEMTKRWWASVSSMPHCCRWTETDWAFALTTALIAGEVHAGELRYANELRVREKVMGTTHDARLGLRLRYVDPEPQQERPLATVTAIDDYADVLS